MSVHQCAKNFNRPHLLHERTIRDIANYLASTSTYVYLPYGNLRLSTYGVVYKPNKEKGIKCYIDADFTGGWGQAAADNAENFMLHTVCVITFAGCPVSWCRKLRKGIFLSTTEVEYIALSQAMRDVIPSMALINEVSFILDIHIPKPEAFFKVFEDNQSCIAIA